jgi:hypothetical protein
MNEIFHPDWLDLVMLIVLPLVAIVQWVVIVPAAKFKGCFGNFDELEDQELVEAVEKPIPFIDDLFFIAWNILPIALLVVYYRLWSDWNAWATTVQLRAPGALKVEALEVMLDFPNYAVVQGVIVFISLVACLSQFKKVAGFEHDKSFLYWWDLRISRRIFWVRLVALFFNFYTVAYVLVKMLAVTVHAVLMPFLTDVEPALGHPDGFAGFAPYGQICLVLAFGYMVIFAIALLGATDHMKQGGLHHAGDIALFTPAAVLAPVVLVLPAARIHKLVAPALADARGALEPLLECCAAAVSTPIHALREPIEGCKAVFEESDTVVEVIEAYCGIAANPELTEAILQTKAGIGILDFDLVLLVATAVLPFGWRYRDQLRKFAVHRVSRRLGDADDATVEAVAEAVAEALDEVVEEAVDEAVDEAVAEALDEAVDEAVAEALDEALDEAVDEAVAEALDEAANAERDPSEPA